MSGKSIRMERIIDRRSHNAVIVPLDHGISMGPLEGLIDMKKTVNDIAAGGATAVIEQKGMVNAGHRNNGRDIGLILHLSASTDIGSSSNEKVLVATVAEAIKMDADAVSVQVNFGAASEPQMIRDAGQVSRECADWGMPLIVMAYPRGPTVKNAYDPKLIAHAARAAAELGADIVKVNYTGEISSFSRVVDGAEVPVVIAGGPKMGSDLEILNMVHDSLAAGGHGVSIGRNVFQHRNVRGITAAISQLVTHGRTVNRALEELKQ
ncbi:MAG: 2-amino-3,7-dideoxy-D-threo-hept-6-ulosonate synthase [Methanomethylophilus sp.]